VISPTVGISPTLELTIEGVKVAALIDSGSQSTIISRAVLHKIGQELVRRKKSLPELKCPSIKLFSKDGRKEGCPLNVTAETILCVEVDGRSAKVPVFIQPDSEQQCLLGMNAFPKLGIKLLRPNGESLVADLTTAASVAAVHFVQAERIPGRKGRFLDVRTSMELEEGAEALFQPKVDVLAKLGLSSGYALITAQAGSIFQVPF